MQGGAKTGPFLKLLIPAYGNYRSVQHIKIFSPSSEEGKSAMLEHRKNWVPRAQGRIIHCAGCTMGGGPRRKGAPADQLPNFYHAVLTFERSVYA